MKRLNKTITNSLAIDQIIPDLPIVYISKEFCPDWIDQIPENYICPICGRPHHKEPGPFTYGITINNDERTCSMWVKSFDCCEIKQLLPYQFVKKERVNSENIVPILKKVFSFK